jgi:hypothetical protein
MVYLLIVSHVSLAVEGSNPVLHVAHVEVDSHVTQLVIVGHAEMREYTIHISIREV